MTDLTITEDTTVPTPIDVTDPGPIVTPADVPVAETAVPVEGVFVDTEKVQLQENAEHRFADFLRWVEGNVAEGEDRDFAVARLADALVSVTDAIAAG